MKARFIVLALAVIGVALLSIAEPADATTISIAKPFNVLSGATAVSSTTIAAPFPASAAVDDLVRAVPPADQDHGLIFSNSDPNQRLGLRGSFGAIEEIRIWTIPAPTDNRIPGPVTVRSSLNNLSGAGLITVGNYETLLGNFSLNVGNFTGTAPGTDNTYATLVVSAPAGTQSLYFAFGSVGDGKGERITEIQAFIPEPSTVAFAGLALLGFAGFVRRRK